MKKLLIIILIFLLIVSTFCVYSYAVDISDNSVTFYQTFKKSNVKVILPDGYGETYRYFAIFCGSYYDYFNGYRYKIFFSYKPIDCYTDDIGYVHWRANDTFFCYPEELYTKSSTIDFRNYDFNLVRDGYSTSTATLSSCIYCNFDLKDSSGVIKHPADEVSFNFPFFVNSDEDLSTGKFDYVVIDGGDFNSFDSPDINFVIRKIVNKTSNDVEYESQEIVYNTVLNHNSKYINNTVENSYYKYSIPQDDLGINFDNEGRYIFSLEYEYQGKYTTDDHYITIGGLTDLDKQLNSDKITQDKLDKQTEAIEENTETNKNIFERLGEMLNFLNPFSKDFFVYKLIELLGDLIKSLFVPSDDFLSNWFTEVSDYFEDAFGILYYPVDLVIQVLGRFGSISGQEPIISFGNFSLFGAILIPAYTYNFNDILSNETLKTIHNFYLITIDVILWLGLLVYCKNVLANIFGGKFTDDVIDEIQDPRR